MVQGELSSREKNPWIFDNRVRAVGHRNVLRITGASEIPAEINSAALCAIIPQVMKLFGQVRHALWRYAHKGSGTGINALRTFLLFYNVMCRVIKSLEG